MQTPKDSLTQSSDFSEVAWVWGPAQRGVLRDIQYISERIQTSQKGALAQRADAELRALSPGSSLGVSAGAGTGLRSGQVGMWYPVYHHVYTPRQ